ncbi:MAG: CHAT domain-containing protein [Alphaproteobacteria bacterium]|nr:CHAT domain-containing protein [Alphaproteobacteria bacterium]
MDRITIKLKLREEAGGIEVTPWASGSIDVGGSYPLELDRGWLTSFTADLARGDSATTRSEDLFRALVNLEEDGKESPVARLILDALAGRDHVLLQLGIPEDSWMQDVCWEAARPEDGAPLSVRGRVLVAREVLGRHGARERTLEPPLKVLIAHTQDGQFEAELLAEDLKADVEVDEVSVFNLNEHPLKYLASRVAHERPQVLHYIGHGGLREVDGGLHPHLLVKGPKEGEGWEKVSEWISALEDHAPALVFLQCCSTAAVGDGGLGSAAGLFARRLGVECVLAQLWPVEATDADELKGFFYDQQALGRWRNPALSFAAARRCMRLSTQAEAAERPDRRERSQAWASSVLFLRGDRAEPDDGDLMRYARAAALRALGQQVHEAKLDAARVREAVPAAFRTSLRVSLRGEPSIQRLVALTAGHLASLPGGDASPAVEFIAALRGAGVEGAGAELLELLQLPAPAPQPAPAASTTGTLQLHIEHLAGPPARYHVDVQLVDGDGVQRLSESFSFRTPAELEPRFAELVRQAAICGVAKDALLIEIAVDEDLLIEAFESYPGTDEFADLGEEYPIVVVWNRQLDPFDVVGQSLRPRAELLHEVKAFTVQDYDPDKLDAPERAHLLWPEGPSYPSPKLLAKQLRAAGHASCLIVERPSEARACPPQLQAALLRGLPVTLWVREDLDDARREALRALVNGKRPSELPDVLRAHRGDADDPLPLTLLFFDPDRPRPEPAPAQTPGS